MLNELETGPAAAVARGGEPPCSVARMVVDRGERPQPVTAGRVGALVVQCWAPMQPDRPTMDQVMTRLQAL